MKMIVGADDREPPEGRRIVLEPQAKDTQCTRKQVKLIAGVLFSSGVTPTQLPHRALLTGKLRVLAGVRLKLT